MKIDLPLSLFQRFSLQRSNASSASREELGELDEETEEFLGLVPYSPMAGYPVPEGLYQEPRLFLRFVGWVWEAGKGDIVAGMRAVMAQLETMFMTQGGRRTSYLILEEDGEEVEVEIHVTTFGVALSVRNDKGEVLVGLSLNCWMDSSRGLSGPLPRNWTVALPQPTFLFMTSPKVPSPWFLRMTWGRGQKRKMREELRNERAGATRLDLGPERA